MNVDLVAWHISIRLTREEKSFLPSQQSQRKFSLDDEFLLDFPGRPKP